MTFECSGFALLFVHLTCTAPEVQVDAARFCKVAAPIRYSTKDTAETRRQVRAHNAAGVAACGWGRR